MKTMLVNNNNPDPSHLEYEWELKEKLAGNNPLAEVNGEIAFADRAAFFANKSEQYYIASYPFLPGETMRHYADQYNTTKSADDAATLTQAIYRYAQVSARLHFDPNDPPEENEVLLNRPVQIYLEDRNSANELYDAASDKVYLIDYPIAHRNYRTSVMVRNPLEDAFVVILSKMDYSDENAQFFVDAFFSGYIDALPKYDSTLLIAMLNDVLDALHKGEVEEVQEDEFIEDFDPRYQYFPYVEAPGSSTTD